MPELNPAEVWRLFEDWLNRAPDRDEIHVDLGLCAPAITMLGGLAARDLLSKLDVPCILASA